MRSWSSARAHLAAPPGRRSGGTSVACSWPQGSADCDMGLRDSPTSGGSLVLSASGDTRPCTPCGTGYRTRTLAHQDAWIVRLEDPRSAGTEGSSHPPGGVLIDPCVARSPDGLRPPDEQGCSKR